MGDQGSDFETRSGASGADLCDKAGLGGPKPIWPTWARPPRDPYRAYFAEHMHRSGGRLTRGAQRKAAEPGLTGLRPLPEGEEQTLGGCAAHAAPNPGTQLVARGAFPLGGRR